MKKILLLLLLLIPLSTIPVFATEDISFYEDHGFLIEYPSEWEIVDTWNVSPNKIFFKSDYLGLSGISIILADRYELNDLHKREYIEIKNVDQSLLDVIESDLETLCRINKDGVCWSFKLLDSKIIDIDSQKAISIKYSATVNDQETTFRIIMLPDEENYWFVVAKAVGDVSFEKFEKSIQSFHLDSEITIEPIISPAISVPTFQIPFDSDIVLEKKIDVNLILIGEKWPSSAKSSISNNLPNYRDPLYAESQEKIGIRHTYNYNFVSVSEGDVMELSKFMNENSLSVPIFGSNLIDVPIWQAYWVVENHPEWVEFDNSGNISSYNIDYRLIDALATEEYIHEKFIDDDPELSVPNSVNLVFIAMDLEDANFLRNYSVSSKDDASGKSFTSTGLMGFGGNNNMLFFDLYAAPWIDFDIQLGEYEFPPWIETLHDCNFDQCISDLVSFHTSETLQYVISPHLLYPVKNADKYVIDVVVYTKPGGSNTVTPQTLSHFVDKDKVKKELEFLYPFSEWEINFELERRDTRGLTYEFKKELEHTSNFNFENIFGEEKSIQILDVDKIQPHLISWAETKTSGSNEIIQTIPVLIEIDSSHNYDIYLDSYGVTGIAPSIPDSDESCCAFGVTSQKKLWSDEIGFTDLLIHEVGHTMGLMHPFMSTDNFGELTVNQYFNWYSSPMTYSSPNVGCGTLFNLIYPDPCGNASLSFTDFERNMISDARLAFLWKEIDSNLKNQVDQNLAKSSKIFQDSKNAYQKGDVYSLKGSLKLAIDAFQSDMSSEKNPGFLSTSKGSSSNIPDWIMNNAKWWADGKIDDDSFVQGIQHLVNEEVISISSTSSNSTISGDGVPSWVKNNAKWWSEGLIEEGDFLKGIEYLVKSGVIQVN